MLGLGLLCILAGAVILIWELRGAAEQLGKKVPRHWKKWRLIPEHIGTWLFYLMLVVVLSVSFFVLWRVYS